MPTDEPPESAQPDCVDCEPPAVAAASEEAPLVAEPGEAPGDAMPSEAPVVRGRITFAQYNLLAALCTSVFLSGCLTSMLAPILPARLDQLHSTAIMRGAIFGAYPFTVAVVSLFVPQLIDRFGRKPLLVLGLAAEGALVILFGNVHVERHGGDNAALWLYLSLRVLTGICEAVQNTVLLLYATDEFEEQGSLGTVMGWEESCAGLGFIVGPSAGAVLYQLGGFGTPFLVLGLLFLALLPLIPFALRNVKHRAPTHAAARKEARPPWRAYMTYDVVNAGCATLLMGSCFGAIMPTLSPHLQRRLGLTKEWTLGAVYTIPALVYGVSCPLAGILADRGSYRRLMRVGFSLLAGAFVMMGPCPLLRPIIPVLWVPGHPAAWVWAIVAMVLFGVGGACGFVPTMPAMQRGAAHLGPAATEVVASVYWTVYFAGEGLGPSLGTLLVSGLGAGWGYTGVAVIVIAYLEASRQHAKLAPPENSLPPLAGHGPASSQGGEPTGVALQPMEGGTRRASLASPVGAKGGKRGASPAGEGPGGDEEAQQDSDSAPLLGGGAQPAGGLLGSLRRKQQGPGDGGGHA